MKRILESLRKTDNKLLSREEKSRKAFERKAREQFMRLKEKGLSITVVTL